MKTFLLLLIIYLFFLTYFCQYKLVWSDEFEGNALNLDNWSYDIGDSWYNNEIEAYSRDNVYVQDGLLKIQARKEPYGSKNYTSGRIKTQGKHFWIYGKFEARVKIPSGKGLWPAFWMYVEKEDSIYKEITIMESFNPFKNQTLSACWYGGPNENPFNFQAFYNLTHDGFHVYSAEWQPGQIDYFVDNNRFLTCLASETAGNWSLDNVPFHILFNMAVGGDRPGNPYENTKFPINMYVDWVRVYQSFSQSDNNNQKHCQNKHNDNDDNDAHKNSNQSENDGFLEKHDDKEDKGH